jgi:uncharacterized membrane protein YeaQ/YmgE (transglycosylase-associated protein family)
MNIIKLQPIRWLSSLILLGLLCCGASTGYAQSNSAGVGERVSAAAQDTKVALQEASATAVNKIDEIWRRVDEGRLKNRTRDEVAAWIIVGLLVDNVISLFSVKPSTLGQRLGKVLVGLVGAFIGGIVTHVWQLDFGMGPVLIRYEDLLISFIGGLVLVMGVHFLVRRKHK